MICYNYFFYSDHTEIGTLNGLPVTIQQLDGCFSVEVDFAADDVVAADEVFRTDGQNLRNIVTYRHANALRRLRLADVFFCKKRLVVKLNICHKLVPRKQISYQLYCMGNTSRI